MLKIQQKIAKSKARAEVYGKHDTKCIDGRSQLLDDKIDLAQRCQPKIIGIIIFAPPQKQCIAKGQ